MWGLTEFEPKVIGKSDDKFTKSKLARPQVSDRLS